MPEVPELPEELLITVIPPGRRRQKTVVFHATRIPITPKRLEPIRQLVGPDTWEQSQMARHVTCREGKATILKRLTAQIESLPSHHLGLVSSYHLDMRRATFVVAMSLILAACTSHPRPQPTPPQPSSTFNQFEGQGQIQGSFRAGGQALRDGWIEMIELTGPVSQRCGTGDCGLSMEALRRGVRWNTGSWRVVPPPVDGWKSPAPFVVVVQSDKLTTIEADYELP
jgi:hypothetical protein